MPLWLPSRPKIARLAVSALLLLGLLAPAGARAQDLTVFAAASLTNALTDVCAAWARQGHPMPRLSFAASSTLARQIEQGAPANIFASADERWMDDLARHDAIVPQSRRDLLRNDLALIVPATAPRHVTIGPGFDLAGLLGPTGRLATGDPAHVPVGIYAKQALEHLGLWSSVAQRLAPTDDVRAALLLVERGEAPAGIVYGTDAAISRQVMVAGVFPADSHDPITYPFALTRSGDTPDARALFAFMAGPEARRLYAKYGFIPTTPAS
ncbi:MAG: molybdate ABC transporter substrate-binding protein [Acetobacteraceae bacterium]|nr:molybdate ABC transporter substrate-binding protein [Acetobacteraceae bacterium]